MDTSTSPNFGRVIVMLHGKPGCGKTSAAADAIKAENSRNYKVLSIGNHLRGITTGAIESSYQDKLMQFQQQLTDAKPLPNNLLHSVIEEYFQRLERDTHVVILDGYPRYVPQLRHLEFITRSLGMRIAGAIHVDVTDAVAVDRIVSRGVRSGERAPALAFARSRVLAYVAEQSEFEASLKQMYPLLRVDGMQPRDAVAQCLRIVLRQLL